MVEQTGLWTWRNLEEESSLTEVTAEQIARIRELAVIWETAESGAAALADDGFFEIDDTSDPQLLAALEVFMATATLDKSGDTIGGLIRNPYAGATQEDRYGLESTPAPEIAQLLASGEDIAWQAEADEIILWENASLRAGGIDPKRPFGTGNVSRDVRALIDPDKQLSNAAFAKRRKWLESRLMLYLLFFVQNAQLEPSLWRRGTDWQWRQVSADEPPPGEALTRVEWADRMYLQNYYENRDYTETLHALIHLAWNNRLSGSYAQLAEQFSLATHFDGPGGTRYEGTVEERFQAALAAFPERRGETPRPWFTLSYTRILNAQARFDDARRVLEAADLFTIPAEEVDLATINPIAIAWAEGLIARHGSGMMSEDEFQSALSGMHSAWRTPLDLWHFIWNVRHDPDQYEEGAESPGVGHARAMVAQLELARGGYDPDQKLKRF
ncbi:hypothetical protein GRI97_11555 [Altererythrobacter xixiisoli]|uniref:Uncharacterized protein n=1 Tax=Croceibacterium xixiisoli TaxID=1476466 RepID=A0A6I4TUK7_9SPHN|nr:hypothetical protein [Croceibacterium xixiisoli]MXO99624.1 hypothetical protein [Croceibacterium xixiisoli]